MTESETLKLGFNPYNLVSSNYIYTLLSETAVTLHPKEGSFSINICRDAMMPLATKTQMLVVEMTNMNGHMNIQGYDGFYAT